MPLLAMPIAFPAGLCSACDSSTPGAGEANTRGEVGDGGRLLGIMPTPTPAGQGSRTIEPARNRMHGFAVQGKRSRLTVLRGLRNAHRAARGKAKWQPRCLPFC